MAVPEYGTTFGDVNLRYIAPMEEPSVVRPAPESPEVLAQLSKASADYAQAAGAFIQARDNLNDARNRWQECRDRFAKVAEHEGV